MYVNATSNERAGEAFVLVRRGDRDLHIYGSGKDRRVIVSWHKDRDDDVKADPKLPTGGAAGPSATVQGEHWPRGPGSLGGCSPRGRNPRPRLEPGGIEGRGR